MDHLPHPQDPFERVTVPRFDGPAYTAPFETFPSRHDWDARGGLQSTDPARFLGLAQSWVFFGLLHDFLHGAGVAPQEGGVILDDLLCDARGLCLGEPEGLDDGWESDEALQYTEPGGTQAPRWHWLGTITNSRERGFVTTKRLWWHLNTAICSLREKPNTEVEQAVVQLEKHLSEAQTFVHRLEHELPNTVVHTHDEPDANVAFEEQCLAFCLSVHALRHALIQARLIIENGHGMEGMHGSTLLARRMARQGWCPYQAEWVAKNFGLLSGYYISLLGPKPTPLQCHVACNGRGCSLLQIDEASYETAHRPGCGKDCGTITPSVAEMCAILEGGGIPILVLRCDEEGRLQVPLDVRVERCTPDRDFYAVSHVWSDGMGNPLKNTTNLPGVHARVGSAQGPSRKGNRHQRRRNDYGRCRDCNLDGHPMCTPRLKGKKDHHSAHEADILARHPRPGLRRRPPAVQPARRVNPREGLPRPVLQPATPSLDASRGRLCTKAVLQVRGRDPLLRGPTYALGR